MRQRNDTQTVWLFAETTDEPAHEVAPGETTDHPALLDGWTALGDPEPMPGDQSKPSIRKRAATADEKDGGEPK